MNVVVLAPGQYLGDLTRDISRRRGEILSSSLDKGRCQLHASVHGAQPLCPEQGGADRHLADAALDPLWCASRRQGHDVG